jgi:putative lipoprotein
VPDGVVATLRLDDGVASGSGGCNTYSGGYTLEGGSLTFGPLRTTLMMCAEPAASVESSYLAALASVAAWAIDGSTLTLSDEGGAALLVYAPHGAPSIVGSWIVTGYNTGSAITSPIGGADLTAVFGADGTVSGSSGCNRYHGSYTLGGESGIAIGPLASTKMACAEAELMTQEQQFLAALAASVTYERAPQGLTLMDATGMITVTLGATAEQPYLGDWTVTGINNGREAVVSPILGTELTATFSAEGVVSGSSGCNSYSGPYAVDGTAMSIGPLASTLMACASDELNAQEQEYLAALQRVATWEAEGSSLVLRDAGGAMQVTFTR